RAAPAPQMAVTGFEPLAGSKPGAQGSVRLPEGQALPAVPGELIVGREAGKALPAFDGAVVAQTLFLARSYDLVRVPAGQEAEAMAFYSRAPGVTSVVRNQVIEPHALPSADPLLPYQWQYGSDGSDVFSGWAAIDAGIGLALSNVNVAVVDSGVDPSHPDLSPGVVGGFLTTTALDKVTAPSTTTFEAAIDDHGTLVAGVIAARRNSIGNAGVAPGVRIVPLKDAQPTTGTITTLGLLNAITIAAYYNQADSPYAWLKNVGNGSPVAVCNISQGIPGSLGVQAAYQDAIDNAVAHGVAVVVSVGNEASEPTVPSNSPSAIAVSVTMRYLGWELLAPYSNHGDPVFVSGPGNMIWSTSRSTGGDYTKAYKLFNGTSAAAPFVSATLALIHAKYVGSTTPRDRALVARLKEKLRTSVDDLGPGGWDPQFGWGRVNIRKALSGTF
ncbi:MAG: S8/S53 family peptidase, partial [Candidatus Sericytochromatia bacterium]|nr:S8/S53 family peptidase [Candidatus Tanganyikabacteria bacterium]